MRPPMLAGVAVNTSFGLSCNFELTPSGCRFGNDCRFRLSSGVVAPCPSQLDFAIDFSWLGPDNNVFLDEFVAGADISAVSVRKCFFVYRLKFDYIDDDSKQHIRAYLRHLMTESRDCDP